jgi:site-specific DNA-methyltransferase (adenine-specific)
MKTRAIHGDNLEFLRSVPDKYYDLAVIDPPYGIGEHGGKSASRCKATGVRSNNYTKKDWDKEPPSEEFFKELFRVSKDQIIFGANHFISRIPFDASCWLVWDKENGDNDFADCELAWTSFKSAVRIIRWKWHGMLQKNMKNKEKRIHPTQKPVGLYVWIFQKFAKKGFKILDTHLGSGSSRIATEELPELELEFDGIEIDLEYYENHVKRYNDYKIIQKINFPI